MHADPTSTVSSGESKPPLHLVDGDGNVCKEREFYDFFAARNITPKSAGVKYLTVGVFGGQSTGKSTLLNHLFGTAFPTMDSDLGRSQTTRGIYASAASIGGEKPLLVLDFEGADGMERGEDQSFERRLSLFALAVTDLLIMNMWATEVGRFNAANLSLLRTVFEVNLHLFHGRGAKDDAKKTKLMFVLRDHTSGPLEKLVTVVRASLTKVWEGVQKPEGYEASHSTFEDCFELLFAALPHYELQHEQFLSGAKRLQKRFVDATDGDFLFASQSSSSIPFEAFSHFMGECWKEICRSRDLDLPSQKEMLAKYRCTEVCDQQEAAAAKIIAKWRDEIRKGNMVKIDASGLADKLVAEFREETALYSKDVVEQFAETLKENVLRAAEQVVQMMASQVVTDLLKTQDVAGTVDRLLIVEGKNWEELRTATAAVVSNVKTKARSVEKLKEALSGHEWDVIERKVREEVHGKLRTKLDAMAADAQVHMHKRFEHVLHHEKDSATQVRFFATTAGLMKAYPEAREAGLELLKVLAVFDLHPADDKPEEEHDGPRQSSELLNESQRTRAAELYAQQCEFTIKLQQKSIESGAGAIPAYVWVLLLALGANEIYAVLTSPVLLIGVIVLSYIFLRTFIVNQYQMFIETGPIAVTVPLKGVVDQIVAHVGGGGSSQKKEKTE